MAIAEISSDFDWKCGHTWRRASVNTLWCLAGCSIGDFGTIFIFQLTGIGWSNLAIMMLAIVNGILTSIALETAVLSRQKPLANAFRTAVGMTLISKVAMEVAMHLVAEQLTGGAMLNWWVIPMMLVTGF